MGEEGKKEEERTKKCHKKEMRGGAGGRQWLLTFANDTNTIVRKQLQVSFFGIKLANSDDLGHLHLHVL